MSEATEPRPRSWMGAVLAVLALTAAAAAALLAGPTGGVLALAGEFLSSSASNTLRRLAASLPFSYALGAGMAAAVNPCGFALLPGYLAFSLGQGQAKTVGGRLRQATTMSMVVVATFILLFGAVGAGISAASSSVIRAFPWAGLVAGIALATAGGYLLSGGKLAGAYPGRLAGPFRSAASRPGIKGYAAYGLAYGLASLGCTLPVFLTVVGFTLASGSFWAAALQYVLYGLGMGLVLSAVTLSTAALRFGLVRTLRRAGSVLMPISAGLLMLSGAYIFFYWLTVGGILAGLLG